MDWTPDDLPAIMPGRSFSRHLNNYVDKIEFPYGQDNVTGCEIHIRNYHENLELRDPEYYIVEPKPVGKEMESTTENLDGIPPTAVISPGYVEMCKFVAKTATCDDDSSSCGVLVYEIDHITRDKTTNEVKSRESDGSKLILMWSVHSTSINQQALGIRAWDHLTANKELFDEMCYRNEKCFRRKQFGCRVQYDAIVCSSPVKVSGMLSGDPQAVWGIDIK